MKIDAEELNLRMSFLRKILMGQVAFPISQYEVEISNRADDLIYIDQLSTKEINYSLISLLMRLEGLVKKSEAVIFLLDVAENTDEFGISVALESLDRAVTENVKLKQDDLIEVFKNCADGAIAPSLMVNIFGELREDEQQEEKPVLKNSGLNLEAMKNFK